MPEATPATEQDRARDRALVARLVTGDGDAWADFRARFLPRFGACVRRAGVKDDDVEDACSFVFEALLADDSRRLRQWDGRAQLSTYLYTVTSRLAVDFLRQRPRFVHPEEGDPVFEAGTAGPVVLEAEKRAIRAGLREAILQCLFQMPPGADREILLFRYYAGLNAQEIADYSSRSRNAVDQALHRAHRHLKGIAERVRPELLVYLGGEGHDRE